MDLYQRIKAKPGDMWNPPDKLPEGYTFIAGQGLVRNPKPKNLIESSFDRMNIGKIGDLGGRMGELEKASMRLAEAASQRSMIEKGKEIELKTAAEESGIGRISRAQERADLESKIRRLESKKPTSASGAAMWGWDEQMRMLRSQLSSLQ